MFLSLLVKPSDEDIERYPAVHLTGPHEWDPSVLDYSYPSGPMNGLGLTLTLMNLGITPMGQSNSQYLG